MKSRTTRQALAEDIKRELLMDLSHSQSIKDREQHLRESIKREILMELSPTVRGAHLQHDRGFVQSIKNEILAQIQGPNHVISDTAGYFYTPDRMTIDSIKREVIAQIEADQETQQELYAQDSTANSNYGAPDPVLVQTIKNSVMAELNTPGSS